MSGDDVPYQLRPNKFIDRQLFSDLLARIVPVVGAEKYIYISMGGKHLVDHNTLYRQLGIRHLCAFDQNSEIVRRQMKNRPIDGAICLTLSSASLAGEIDSITAKFARAANLIIWLDYTRPGSRLSQLQETVEVLKRLQTNDILRITLNAHLPTLGPSDEWKREGAIGPTEYRATKLRRQLGSFMPTDAAKIGDDEFAAVLAQCIRLAVAKAEVERDAIRFKPLLITTYQDGQRMMTATLIAVKASKAERPVIGLSGWDFAAKGWDTIVSIEAPDLSAREKFEIDQFLSRSPSKILSRLKYLPGEDKEKSRKALADYKKLHRYYPSFYHIDL
jgi:hypothetical protein